MYIWKLAVVDFTSPNWDMSTCKGDIIVRARDEVQARLIATRDFTVVNRRLLGGGALHSPWENIRDTSCEKMENSPYSTRGEARVLEITQPALAPQAAGGEIIPSVFNVSAFKPPDDIKQAS